MSKNLFNKINNLVDNAKTILISGHENPDGDCMGSSLALASILRRRGKDVSIFKEDPFPFNFLFLEGSDDHFELPDIDPDLFIILDSGSPERVGKTLYSRLQKTKSPKILIDHHIQSDEKKAFYTEFLVETTASATAVLIYNWAKELSFELNRAESEAIYAAIMSDTGGLRYGNTDKESFLILGDLVDKVDPWEISSNMYENVPFETLKMLSEVLADMKLLSNGKAAVIKITLEQFEKYSLRPDQVDGFVNFARSVSGVQLAARFKEKSKNLWKVSMRSKGHIDSAAIAGEFNGGGHKNAAGFDFKGTFEEGLKKIEEIINRVSG